MAIDRSVDKVFKELAALDKKLRNKIIRQAQRKGAKLLAAEIKSNAPVETGRTRKSVKVGAGKRKKDTITTVVYVQGGHEEPFIGQVEFGNRHQTANPFIRRSVASKRDQVVENMAHDISEALEKP